MFGLVAGLIVLFAANAESQQIDEDNREASLRSRGRQ
jgi:hypothetical protein